LPADKLFISLYLDEDVSKKIAAILKNRGFDVSHAVEAGMLSASDEEQLNKAILEKRTFLTHNKKHFRILHERYLTSGKKHFGIIVASRKRNPFETIKKLLNIIQTSSPEEMENQIRFI
jgi:predicted nuclease of predicted toxin-antitoxin system